MQFLLLPFEIIKAVRDVGALDLFASEVLNLVRSSLNIFLAKVDQGHMFFKVFLFPVNARFFNFQAIRIFQFGFRLFKLNLQNNPFKIVVQLRHNPNFPPFHLF
jgi:hypothetical protein